MSRIRKAVFRCTDYNITLINTSNRQFGYTDDLKIPCYLFKCGVCKLRYEYYICAGNGLLRLGHIQGVKHATSIWPKEWFNE